MACEQFNTNQKRKDNERRSNEWTSLKKTNADLGDALSKTMGQQDIDRMTINILNEQLAMVQTEKESIETNLKGSNIYLTINL